MTSYAISETDMRNYVEYLLAKARKAGARYQPKEAVSLYDEVLAWDRWNKAAWSGKSNELFHLRIREKTNEYIQEEIDCYEMMLNLEDEEEQYFTWYMRAGAHDAIGQHELAILCYERYLELSPDDEERELKWGARHRIIDLSKYVSAKKVKWSE